MGAHPEGMNAEVAHAVKLAAGMISDGMNEQYRLLAAALNVGGNVRDVPSDKVVFGHQDAQPTAAQMLIPAQENRTRVTVWASEDGVYLTDEPGTPPDVGSTIALMAGVPLRLNTRAAIYAVTSGGTPVRVDYVTEFAFYGIAPRIA